MKYMKYLEEDVRVRELIVEKGLITEEIVTKQMDALVDEENLLETVQLN